MKQSIIFFLLSLSVLTACTERIDIHTDDAPPQLVIYGYITTDMRMHTIQITRSSGYFATTKPEGISGATVQIVSDGGEVFDLTEDPNAPGVYQTEYNVYGVEGETYTLNVSLDFDNDGNAEIYTASSYLPLPVQIDSISLAPAPFEDMIEIRVSGYLPERQKDPQNYYSMHVYGNNVLLNDSLKGFELFDDKYLNTREIKNLACFYLDQGEEKTKIQPGDRITLRIDAITKAYADFINEAQSEARGSIPMFSGPPANISTNIRCVKGNVKVSGFFTAFSGRESSTVYE